MTSPWWSPTAAYSTGPQQQDAFARSGILLRSALRSQLWYTWLMKYLLAIAAVLAGALFPVALQGQSIIMTSDPTFSGARVRPAPFLNGSSGFSRFGASRTVLFPPFFGYPPNYPFTYFYPTLWPPLDEQYQRASRIAHGDVEAEVAAQEKEYLSSQVKALTDEVRSLRQQQPAPQYSQELPGAEHSRQSAPHVRPSAHQKFPATVFVFRDGREMEVRDYAIFGETLWVFSDQTARKFPLADFNLAASRQVNEEHGIEFPVSRSHQ